MITCKELAEDVKASLAIKFEESNASIAIITNGTPEGERYTRNKMKVANEVGVFAIKYEFSKAFGLDEIKEQLKHIHDSGIMIQMPFFGDERDKELIDAIPAEQDVDGLGEDAYVTPATAVGVFKYLEANNLIEGKNIVVIGRSKLVGKPLTKLLLNTNATVTMCHSKTYNLADYTKKADVVVCAVGKRNFLSQKDLADHTHVVDVGINFDENGKLCGDCCEDVISKTPVPNGVGLLTTAFLYYNLHELWWDS